MDRFDARPALGAFLRPMERDGRLTVPRHWHALLGPRFYAVPLTEGGSPSVALVPLALVIPFQQSRGGRSLACLAHLDARGRTRIPAPVRAVVPLPARVVIVGRRTWLEVMSVADERIGIRGDEVLVAERLW